MPAYVIARVHVTDWTQYQKYMEMTPAIIAQYGGRFIARGGEVVTFEGPEETHRIVILEFPDMESAKSFYHSAEFQEARRVRGDSATVLKVAVDSGTA